MSQVKIISECSMWNESTTSLIRLCNLFNSRNVDCTFYGFHEWHLDKCKAATFQDFSFDTDDILIIHGTEMRSLHNLKYHIQNYQNKNKISNKIKSLFGLGFHKKKPKQVIYSHSGKEMSPTVGINNRLFDKIHYVSQQQKNYYKKPNCSYFICSDISDQVNPSQNKPNKIAGIISDIAPDQQIEMSIERALNDNMNKIILYGKMLNPIYFYEKIQPLIEKHEGIVQFAGFPSDKQALYDSISDVYHFPESATLSSIEEECKLTNTQFHSNNLANDYKLMTDDQIFNTWMGELAL